jgi:hypothetical protein
LLLREIGKIDAKMIVWGRKRSYLYNYIRSHDKQVEEQINHEAEWFAAFILFLIGLVLIIILPWTVRFSRDFKYFGVRWLLFFYESYEGRGIFFTVMDALRYADPEFLWIPRTYVIAFFLLLIGIGAFILNLEKATLILDSLFGLSSLLATFTTVLEIFYFFSITDRIVFIPIGQLIFFILGLVFIDGKRFPGSLEFLFIVLLFMLAVVTRETLLGIVLPSVLAYGIYKTYNSPALIRRRINRIIHKSIIQRSPIPESACTRIISEARKLGKDELRITLLNLMMRSILHEGRIPEFIISEARQLGEYEQVMNELKETISASHLKRIKESGSISLGDITSEFISEQMIYNLISFAMELGLIDGYFTKDKKRFLTKEYIQNSLKSKLE